DGRVRRDDGAGGGGAGQHGALGCLVGVFLVHPGGQADAEAVQLLRRVCEGQFRQRWQLDRLRWLGPAAATTVGWGSRRRAGPPGGGVEGWGAGRGGAVGGGGPIWGAGGGQGAGGRAGAGADAGGDLVVGLREVALDGEPGELE